MAAKTPVMTISTAGYVDPDRGVYGGVNTSTADLLTGVNQHYDNVQGMRFSRWFFSDIDDTDSWTSNLPGVVAVAWQGADPDDDAVVPFLEEPVAGKITFQAENANSVGWLWVISAR